MSSSTRVLGNALFNPCLRKASWLILDIYDYAKSDLPPHLRPLLDENKKNWTQTDYKNNIKSGFTCEFYEPKMPDGGDPSKFCPPALVFRGSDSEDSDFEQLAVDVNIAINATTKHVMAPSIQREFNWIFSPSKKIPEGLTPETIINERIQTTIFATEDSGNISVSQESHGWLGWAKYNVNIHAVVTLYLGATGDWPNNISQGLGKGATQYDEAIEAVRKAAAIAKKKYQNRLIITGHSLGGGLASAAAQVAQKDDPEIDIWAQTFNAAGLHENTLSEYGAKITETTVNCFCIEDEILTTLQSLREEMPLLGPIFSWADKDMPVSSPH